jgi:hypothetical protein
VKLLASLFVAAAIVQNASPANLAVSTYLKDGFSPSAIASDAAGNVYLAGSAVIDPVSQTMGAVVAKLDPKASQYLYLTYFDNAANDQLSSITVDAAGNVYVVGWTSNPNFPNTGTLGTAPTSITDTRAFVAKLSPNGAVVFSELIGGSTAAQASGVAVTPQGQILASGLASTSGFPVTAGAYSVADSTNQWFLMELNAGASQMIFPLLALAAALSHWIRQATFIWPAAARAPIIPPRRAHIRPLLFKIPFATAYASSDLTGICNTSAKWIRPLRN